MTLSSLINKALRCVGPIFKLWGVNQRHKRLGEDQLRRRLRTIDFHQNNLRARIDYARKQKKERKSLYAQMSELTTERLQIEGQLSAMGPNSVYMQGS